MKLRNLLVGLALVFGLAQAQETVTIRAWTIGPDDPAITRMTNLEAAAEQLNADLEAEGADVRVAVDGNFDTTDWDPYLRRVLLAFQSNQSPDIVQASASLAGTWSAGGFIVPLDDFISQHDQFDDVIPTLWNAVSVGGQVYGIPQDTEARPLYFNKTLLAEMGWSEDEIAALPEQIANGEFTWDDMLALAQDAVDQGVVAEGHGYFHRPSNGPDFTMWYSAFGGQVFDEASGKLVFDSESALRYFTWLRDAIDAGVLQADRLNSDWNLYHQPVTAGEVLFWSGGTWNWAEWQRNFDRDQEWLFENVGFAPQPAYEEGGRVLTLSNPQAYMVSSGSQNQELAVRLLAYTTVPELDRKHAVESAHLPVLTTTPEIANDRFIEEVSYLSDYTTFLPAHPSLSQWQNLLFQGVSAVESGSLSPEEAVELTAAQMQRQLADDVTVR